MSDTAVAQEGRVQKTDLCKHGHEMSAPNVYIPPSSGSRICKACRTAHTKRRIDAALRQVAANIPRFERKWEIDTHLLKRRIAAEILHLDRGWTAEQVARVFHWPLDVVQAFFQVGKSLL